MTAEPAPAQPSSSPTRRRLRVTTGCKTCRKRHVKCDERKPTCLNCGKKNRPCRYDSPIDTSEPSTRRPSQTPGPGECPPATSEINDVAIANEIEDVESQALRDPIVSPQHARNDSQGLEQAPLSAYSPVSPFSATLESILLQAGIDTSENRFPDRPTRETVANLHTPSYLDPSFTQFQDFQPISDDFYESHVQLSDSEIGIFRNYVENVSKWVDSFSHDQPFHRLVPVLALKCPFLLHSCLALSSKQMALIGIGIHESTAVRYYRLALKAVSSQLLDPQNAHRDEVLAACIILSTYEMIDVVGESLGSHLRGVASLLQSRQICGSAFGIRGSCYWTWYRHEIWASLQTGRRISLDERYWQPPPLDTFEGLTIENIANRVIFIFGQCINFCNDDEQGSLSGDELLQARHAKAAELERALDEWKAKLPLSMSSFPAGYAVAYNTSEFPSLWFIFPQSALAHEVYHASKIILALHRPPPIPEARGLGNLASLSLRRHIETSREQIFLTANSGIPDAWSLVSAQCLYIAGLVTEGIQERKRTLELIDQCQKRSGRKTSFIADELRRLWEYSKMPAF